MARPKPRLHPQAPLRRPQGQPTRGKTARNRLRRVDVLLARYDPALLRRTSGEFAHAFFVDLGFGATPITTLESAARLWRVNPNLPVLGVEIDPERVAAAQSAAGPRLEFRLGGFNLPLGKRATGEPEWARAVRAFNVLRQYEEDAVAPAYHQLAAGVLPGGLLIEGTSDPYGRLWTAHLLRRTQAAAGERAAWRHEGLVFSTNLRAPFDPLAFQAILPKDLIHHNLPGEPIHAFLLAWKQAAATAAPFQAWGPRGWFVAAARHLAGQGYRLNLRPHWLRKGYLIWQDVPSEWSG